MEKVKKESLGAAYVRSAIGNVGQIEEQKQLIKDYCEENCIQIVRTYRDIVVSGLRLERPGMNQLIADAAEGSSLLSLLLHPTASHEIQRCTLSSLRK